MDRAEYVFYKLAGGKNNKQLNNPSVSNTSSGYGTNITENPDKSLTFTTTQPPSEIKLEGGWSDAKTYGKGSKELRGYDAYGNTIKHLVDPVKNSNENQIPGYPNWQGVPYSLNDHSRAVMNQYREDPNSISDLTGKGTFSAAYRTAKTENRPSFLFKGKPYATDKYDNFVDPDITVNIPRPTSSTTIEVPNDVKDFPIKEPPGLKDEPNYRFYPNVARYNPGNKSEFDPLKFVADAIPITAGHFSVYPRENFVSNPTSGTTGAGFIQAFNGSGSGVQGGEGIPKSILGNRDETLKYISNDVGNQLNDYILNIQKNPNIPEGQKKDLIEEAKLTAKYKQQDIARNPDAYVWNPDNKFINNPEKAQQLARLYSGAKVQNPKTPEDYAQNIFADITGGGGLNYTKGRTVWDDLGFTNIFSSGGKLVQQGAGLTNNLGYGATTLGAGASLIYNTAKDLIDGQPEKTISPLDAKKRVELNDAAQARLSSVPEEYRRSVSQLLNQYISGGAGTGDYTWNEKEFGPIPKTQEEWNAFNNAVAASKSFQSDLNTYNLRRAAQQQRRQR